MTTEEMKLSLLKHFRYLNYPMVATECAMTIPGSSYGFSSFLADILAVKKTTIVEIEIKQHRCEMVRDLKTKCQKHAFYLRTKSLWDNCYDRWEKGMIRPHKFYFAYHLSPKNRNIHNAAYYPDIPTPYGLIIVYDMDDCKILKRAKWLHRDPSHLEAVKERMCLRLVSENIQLKEKEYDRKNEAEEEN